MSVQEEQIPSDECTKVGHPGRGEVRTGAPSSIRYRLWGRAQ